MRFDKMEMSRVGFLVFATQLWFIIVESQISDLSTDKSSLAALKSHVTSDPKNILTTGWSNSSFVCNWTGVSCGGDPLRVVGLNLSYAGLIRTVPPHLGNLSSLLVLSFENNSFHGNLPMELSRLRRLSLFDFGSNGLSGVVPSWLWSLPKLESLSLQSNQFSGLEPPTTTGFNSTTSLLETVKLYDNRLSGSVPIFLFNMSSLKYISIAKNEFRGTIPGDICKNVPKIQAMYFGGNRLSGSIPSELWQCTKLNLLGLDHNNFSGVIPPNIQNLTDLRNLYLFDNNLTGPIPLFLFNMSSLNDLSLSGNEYSGTIPDNMCQHLPLIQKLHFGRNMLSGSLPSKLWQCKELRLLSLEFNQFSGDLHSLVNSTNLRDLFLGGNRFSGGLSFGQWASNLEGLYLYENELSGSIPKSISNASQLIDIDIGDNHLNGFIPDTISHLKNLQWLALSNNNLTIHSNLLSSILTLRELEKLDLSLNPLNSNLPSSIGLNLSTSIESIYLGNCSLSGVIPDGIANFSSLIVLSLQGNRLSGSVPSSIGRLQDLQGLYLFKNSFNGHVPPQLCPLQRLFDLRLGGNFLSGPIPSCFGNITSLRKLSLYSNKFTSRIPPSLWGLRDILELDLSGNYLTGSLPPDIGNLKTVTSVDVSNNRLSGNVSSSIGSLAALTALSLATNKFQGSIPDSFGDLLILEYLDLSNNDLSGKIPKSLEKLSDLVFLNLSFNKLYGEIPSGGPFRNFTSQSFIHNYDLCGEPRLQVIQCKHEAKKANKAWILRYVLPCILLAIIILALLFIVFRWKRKKNSNSVAASNQEALDKVITRRRVTRFELSTATNGFDEENLLGTGSFGSVYKGALSDGLTVAIKVFNLEVEEAFESFATECQVLCGVCHRNLVKIVTCCSSPDFKALVLEYMPRGSLEKWLYTHGFSLNFLQRLNIMIDVASALEYLHYGYSTPIVHCDLKPSNVLLDENMIAHVADFGIAKIMSGDDSMTRTMTLATIGYMAPEYGVGGVVSRKGDVYSFGIMLMEILTKKKPVDEMFSEKMSMKQWIADSLPHSIDRVIDPDLLKSDHKELHLIIKDCASSIIDLALACSALSPDQRIDMKDVVTSLTKIKIKYFPK